MNGIRYAGIGDMIIVKHYVVTTRVGYYPELGTIRNIHESYCENGLSMTRINGRGDVATYYNSKRTRPRSFFASVIEIHSIICTSNLLSSVTGHNPRCTRCATDVR